MFVFEECIAVDIAMMQLCCELHSVLCLTFFSVFSMVLLFLESIIKIVLALERPKNCVGKYGTMSAFICHPSCQHPTHWMSKMS